MEMFDDHPFLSSEGYFEPGPDKVHPGDAGPDWMRNPVTPADHLACLIHEKGWEHLGITGREFADGWVTGAYVGDRRPAVLAIARLMRTGGWSPPASLRLVANTSGPGPASSCSHESPSAERK